MNAMKKKTQALLLALLMILCAACSSGDAPRSAQEDVASPGGMTPAAAAPEGEAEISAKSEVVYANLAADGSWGDVYVVNVFDVTRAGAIVDYGDYSQILNLTNEYPMEADGQSIHAAADEGRFYYQGTAKAASLPWNVRITYALDGEELSAEEIGGRSGRLALSIRTSPNPEYDASFFDNYLLQASVTLDAQTCAILSAEGGTKAQAGGSEVVSFMVMPGKEGDLSLTADVRDFEMEGIQITAIPLSFAIESPETGDMKEDMGKLSDGVGELNDGVGELGDGSDELADGVYELYDGALQLGDGAGELHDGGVELSDGIGELSDGVLELSDGAEELYEGGLELVDGSEEFRGGLKKAADGSWELLEGSEQIEDGLRQMARSLPEDLDMSALSTLAQLPEALLKMAEGLDKTAGGLDEMMVYLDLALTGLGQPMAAMAGITFSENEDFSDPKYADSDIQKLIAYYQAGKGAEQAYGEVMLLFEGMMKPSVASSTDGLGDVSDALRAAAAGIGENMEGLASLEALPQLFAGISELSKNYRRFHGGLYELVMGMDEMAGGYGELDDGLSEYVDGVGKLSGGVLELYEGILELRDGAEEFADGIGTYRDGVFELADGVLELHGGTSEFADGIRELHDGTSELYDNVRDMPGLIDDTIEEMLAEYDKTDFSPVSFASPRNGGVSAVQFVMQTQKIAAPAADDAQEEEAAQEETLWTRFLDLFR